MLHVLQYLCVFFIPFANYRELTGADNGGQADAVDERTRRIRGWGTHDGQTVDEKKMGRMGSDLGGVDMDCTWSSKGNEMNIFSY